MSWMSRKGWRDTVFIQNFSLQCLSITHRESTYIYTSILECNFLLMVHIQDAVCARLSPSLISLKVKQQRTFLPFLWQWSHGWKSNDYFLLRSLFWELREKRSKNLLINYYFFLIRRCMECRMQKIKENIRREGWMIFKMGTQKYSM